MGGTGERRGGTVGEFQPHTRHIHHELSVYVLLFNVHGSKCFSEFILDVQNQNNMADSPRVWGVGGSGGVAAALGVTSLLRFQSYKGHSP